MQSRDFARIAALLGVLMAGSCAGPQTPSPISEDGAANHPIMVEPSYKSVRFFYAGTLAADDAETLADFVRTYLEQGNGAISISVPASSDQSRTITALAEELVSMGVPRGRILVGTEQSPNDGRIEVGFVSLSAHTDPCGKWTVDAADSSDNLTMPNFGCAVQQNIAAQISNPRDLVELRGTSAGDANRRVTVLGKYEQGMPTSAEKRTEQSGAVSDVAKAGQ
jgi:pilus assembly protein CpaD